MWFDEPYDRPSLLDLMRKDSGISEIPRVPQTVETPYAHPMMRSTAQEPTYGVGTLSPKLPFSQSLSQFGDQVQSGMDWMARNLPTPSLHPSVQGSLSNQMAAPPVMNYPPLATPMDQQRDISQMFTGNPNNRPTFSYGMQGNEPGFVQQNRPAFNPWSLIPVVDHDAMEPTTALGYSGGALGGRSFPMMTGMGEVASRRREAGQGYNIFNQLMDDQNKMKIAQMQQEALTGRLAGTQQSRERIAAMDQIERISRMAPGPARDALIQSFSQMGGLDQSIMDDVLTTGMAKEVDSLSNLTKLIPFTSSKTNYGELAQKLNAKGITREALTGRMGELTKKPWYKRLVDSDYYSSDPSTLDPKSRAELNLIQALINASQ